MNQLKALFKLFTDPKFPYFWGAIASFLIVFGSFFAFIHLIYLFFGIGVGIFLFHFIKDMINRAKATGEWKMQLIFLIVVFLFFFLYQLNKYITG